MALLNIDHISYTYSIRTPFEHTALDDLSFKIPSGQFVGIIGHTGSGKSTLIRHFNALLSPQKGTVYIENLDINSSKKTRKESRKSVGIVFQYPEYQLFEETVYKDIAFGPLNMGFGQEKTEACVKEAARLTGVSEQLFSQSPLDLSGGQKRRIAIAGVIAMQPSILVLDEPTAGLDPEGSEQLIHNLETYRSHTGATVIVVSHSMDEISHVADRILVLNQGQLFMDGSPSDIFSEPGKLQSIGLNVPVAAELAQKLREKGIPLDKKIYTSERLIDEIQKYREAIQC